MVEPRAHTNPPEWPHLYAGACRSHQCVSKHIVKTYLGALQRKHSVRKEKLSAPQPHCQSPAEHNSDLSKLEHAGMKIVGELAAML